MTRRERDIAEQNDPFEQAALWYAKRRGARDSELPTEEEAWCEWMQDAQNEAAYRAVELAGKSRRLLQSPPKPTLKELAADTFDGSVPLVQWRASSESVSRSRWQSGWFWAGLSLAASVVVVLLAPRIMQTWRSASSPSQLVETHPREKKQITLADGSQVFLGDNTQLAVKYGHCQRTIVLNRGEAFFSVAHDPACPFIVIAGNGTIRAVGTRFSIRRTLDHVTVTVADGIVDVRPEQHVATNDTSAVTTLRTAWTEARLIKGQEVSFDGSNHRTAVESEDPQVATAWLEGRREYRREPLTYVVADINRYYGKRIVIGDEAVGQLRFTGRIYESQVADWLRALQSIFPVMVSQQDGDEVVIESVPEASKHPAQPH